MMNYIAVTILGLRRTEFYRMMPGMVYDLIEINKKRHADEKPEDEE